MKDNQTSIEQWASSIEKWSRAAETVITDHIEFDDVVEVHMLAIAKMVCVGELEVNELRQGVIWASALDREAVESVGADINTGPWRHERMARRVMHHAGRTALERVKNERKLLKTRRELNI